MKTKNIIILAGLIITCNIVSAQVNSGHAARTNTLKKEVQAKTVVNKKRTIAIATTNKPAQEKSIKQSNNKSIVVNSRKQRRMERKKMRAEAKLDKKVQDLVMRMTGGYAYFSAP
ncbi:MAG TPA: hypothetical protein VF476_16810 [Chitinophagaceae bacterium]